MQENDLNQKIQRRKFLGGLAAVCAIPCLGMQALYAINQDSKNSLNQDPQITGKHKFENPFPGEFSYQDFFNIRYGEFIRLAKDLEEQMGKEKLIEFLKNRTGKQMFEYGKQQAENSPDNSLKTYTAQFKSEYYDKTLTKEVVQETDKVFELKVTECIWAKTFQEYGAEEIGFAAICYGDYSWPKGFNPKIRMERDKTLMQGHDCCNHKYILGS